MNHIRKSYDGKFDTADLTLTLKFKVDIATRTGIQATADCEALEKALNRSTWDEGRVSFEQEMLIHALDQIIKGAILEVVADYFQSTGGTYSDAVKRADDWMKNDFMWGGVIRCDRLRATVEPDDGYE